MAGLPQDLIENPNAGKTGDDVLSDVLRSIRLSGSLQFCFMPTGAWQTGGGPSLAQLAGGMSNVVPFHLVIEGTCWLKMGEQALNLMAGDVVAFPFGTGHQLGAGTQGNIITPTADLPPKPWREIPVLRYGEHHSRVRLLCGYLICDAMNFRPLRDALPQLLYVRTQGADDAHWLRATMAQITAEVDRPRAGGVSMLERLTEITFIELLRHQIIAARSQAAGWLAALADPSLARCISLIHHDPGHQWSVQKLSAASGVSRSTLTERFEAMLDTSPMRYVRDWRLYLAGVTLSTTTKAIAAVAQDAGYGTEAAFNRAFARSHGKPPAAWRQNMRSSPA